MTRGSYWNAGLFVLVSALFGSVFVGIKAGLTAFPPVFFAALRFDIAAPLLLAYAAWRYDVWIPRRRPDFAGIVVGAVTVIAANNALLFLGQELATPAAASVMYALNPMLAPVFALVLLDRRLDLIGVTGIALGLVGVLIIVQPSPATFMSGSTLGQLLVLGAAASFALGSVLVRRYGTTMDSVPMTAWSMALGALVLHGLSWALGETVAGATITLRVALSVLVVGVASTAVAYPVYFVLLHRIGPVRANLVAYVAPVVAAITGWVLLDEPVTLATVVGFCVVVTGVALLERDVLATEFRRLSRTPEADGR
ncbi:Permease of the drug/metabolite transporter (DMT) superfamily [Halopenitus malekzadehii]|uniref:Permease of the drug/metabolite transporter (DMT) superfamily n=1 Tax=Halopenitus malekzadehii TaxID=1267564 RepID=A0A1H6JSM6_9EURY|nr:DMT family transporter [Halopenitus malekzadehii]SEH65513.1 Permease of the drug/metabolite transporter (DMT) superfamily [Halopenitus malekzadehii]